MAAAAGAAVRCSPAGVIRQPATPPSTLCSSSLVHYRALSGSCFSSSSSPSAFFSTSSTASRRINHRRRQRRHQRPSLLCLPITPVRIFAIGAASTKESAAVTTTKTTTTSTTTQSLWTADACEVPETAATQARRYFGDGVVDEGTSRTVYGGRFRRWC